MQSNSGLILLISRTILLLKVHNSLCRFSSRRRHITLRAWKQLSIGVTLLGRDTCRSLWLRNDVFRFVVHNLITFFLILLLLILFLLILLVEIVLGLLRNFRLYLISWVHLVLPVLLLYDDQSTTTTAAPATFWFITLVNAGYYGEQNDGHK